jgi:mannose-P-dolichol utilization defect protein 1
MGYILVAGGAIIKVPQIIKILVSKSVYGISFTSLLAECMTNWVTIVYSWYRGNPFSIYGENAFILGQNLLIMALFILYGRNVPKGVEDPGQKTINRCITLVAIFIVIMFVTKNPNNWPTTVISYSMVLQISLCIYLYNIVAFARLSQIFHILRCKSTGNLALLTCLLMVIGNLGRMFTIFV